MGLFGSTIATSVGWLLRMGMWLYLDVSFVSWDWVGGFDVQVLGVWSHVVLLLINDA